MRLAALGVMLFAWVLDAAPVPRPKPRPRPPLAGDWLAVWGGSEWHTTLSDDGRYLASRRMGPLYVGRWRLAGDVLEIEERWVGAEGQGPLCRYSFTLLPGKTASKCGGLKLIKER